MTTANLLSLLEQLEENIDEAHDNLEPLITSSAKCLPLLDRARFYTVTVYAIESLLFSYLKLNGVDAKTHPIFKELARVKQYFAKVKLAGEGPTLSLNKDAAGRMINHALAGNQKLDLEKAEREAKEKFLAKRKLKDLETRMKEKAHMSESDLVNEIADITSGLATPLIDEEDDEVLSSEGEDGEIHEPTKRKRRRSGEGSVPPTGSAEIKHTTSNRKKSRKER